MVVSDNGVKGRLQPRERIGVPHEMNGFACRDSSVEAV